MVVDENLPNAQPLSNLDTRMVKKTGDKPTHIYIYIIWALEIRMEALAIRLEATATRLEAIAIIML